MTMCQHRSLWAVLSVRIVAVLILAVSGSAALAQSSDPVVRRVIIHRAPIFSDADRAKARWLPLGIVNRLHIDTREGVIRRELVFRPGDRVGPKDLDEAERKLRRTGFFSEAWVEPIVVAADSVDVMVRTQELWTTALNGSYEKFEDELLWALEIRERNFLGAAKQFKVSRRVDEDRSTWSVGLGDRQLFGGKWQAQGTLSNSDDGSATSWGIARPYFRLESPWTVGSGYFHGGFRPRFYLSEGTYIRPRVDVTVLEISTGRHVKSTSTGVWRTEAGFSSTHQRFSPESELTEFGGDGTPVDFQADVRENRKVHSPYVGITRVSSRFGRERFLFGMGRIEDLALGFEHRIQVGYATRAFGGSLSGLSFSAEHDWLSVSEPLALRASLDAEGLVTSGQAENLSARLKASAFFRIRPGMQMVVGGLGGTSTHLDRHAVYSLGPENGLRAAGFREFAGDRIVRTNAEFRWIYRRGLAGLLTPGITAFADVGAAWFEGDRDLTWKLMRGAIGVGIRIGLNRATTDRPIRIDLGWPILYDNDRSSPILTIGSGQIF